MKKNAAPCKGARHALVRVCDVQMYIDGERATDLMNREHLILYLSPSVHRIGVSTQFDPVVELRLLVTADPRYANRASVEFDDDRRIALHRVAQ
jgi:hypothetical protein